MPLIEIDKHRTMLDSEIFVKTDAGREEIRTRALGLPMAVRAILLMVDGQRSVAAMRSLIAGSKAPIDTLESLLGRGLIEPRVMTPVAPPQPPATQEIAFAALIDEDDDEIDIVLPTIHQTGIVNGEGPSAEAVTAEPVVDRYEHLYTMMNEIVRDFLAPHRRYFILLKIERCTTAEELLEVLHDLRIALAKARGDAFASDVVARLRSAAL